MSLGHVWLVGAGPGDPGLITANGLAALRRADVVVYDRLASRELLDETSAEAVRIDAGKSAGDHTLTQEEINALLVEYGQAGRRVVRLKGGDPYVFGRGGEEALALAEAGVPCTVIPGVTSAIGGLAASGIPVTHRAVATSFAVVTGHEDPTKAPEGVDWARLAGATDTIVVLMGAARLDGIARALIEGGRPASTPAAVIQQASTPHQRAVTGTLATIAETASAASIEVDVGALALQITGGKSGAPKTGLEGKFDLKYCIALALHGRPLSADAFREPLQPDAAVTATATRIKVTAASDLGLASARLRTDTGSGKPARFDVAVAKGHPGNPLTWEDMGEKFFGLLPPAAGAGGRDLFDGLRGFGADGGEPVLRRAATLLESAGAGAARAG